MDTLSVISHPIGRRTFVKGISTVGLGLALGVTGLSAAAETAGKRRRYTIVGTGHRSSMYQEAILGDHKDHAELVGICDRNAGRMEVCRNRWSAAGLTPPPAYAPADFEKMIRETRADVVIVTVQDSAHDDYIVRAMEAGCDAITEKPMTTTAEKCLRIVEARKRTGRHLRVGHNYRYSPPRTQVKDLLMNGEIGDVLSVDFHWMLNTHHGADYFRRWHSHKENSGGLMIHKASHHFDLVNWWLGAVPASVRATGKREFYTPKMAKRMGLESHHERCRTCPEKDKCGFFLDLAADKRLKMLYVDQERFDGYFRDRCVWRPDISIEDTMNVLVTYDNGVTLAYSLNAFNSWEGYTIAFNGTKGRLEHSMVEKVYVAGTQTEQGGVLQEGVKTRVIPLRGPAREVETWSGAGSHAGGDSVMLNDLFLPNPPADKYLRAADERGGAYAMLVGAAANLCFQTGEAVDIAKLAPGVARPEFAPMPTHDEAVPMPPKTKI
ncbi:gfo/Idh/MocA family oxidoreductase [Opitutaceae bacterium EW11]|nr:gfo/Idh/MocA family oxidoreductase [Opitutaceae bacterium EW11]